MAAITVMLVASPGWAVPLAPGAVVFPGGTTSGASPETGGTVLNDNLITFRLDPTPSTPFSDIGGVVQNRVIRSGTLNTMVFAPRIRDTFNIDGGTFGIEAFWLEGFGSFSTDVNYRTDGLGDRGPSSVSRSDDGERLTFRYAERLWVDAINPPGRQLESLFPTIVTDATDYALTGSMTILGRLYGIGASAGDSPLSDQVYSVTINGLAVPVAASVPEPSTLALFSALGIMGLLRRRRRS